ncbi:MAG: hypothetical protein ACI9VR_000625 [Cognaticolwellia sp.]|jgi:hypothetical protein
MLVLISLMLGCGDAVVVADYLSVIHVAPSDGAANITTDAEISATFNDALAADSWTGAVYLDDPMGNPVPSVLSYDADNYTLSLLPDAPLLRDAVYSFTLADTLEGENYGVLPGSITTQFKTLGAPVGGGNTPPVAFIDGVESCIVGEITALTHSSTDADGDTLTVSWRIVDGPPVDEWQGEESALAELIAAGPGEFVVGLVADDGMDASSEAFLTFICSSQP